MVDNELLVLVYENLQKLTNSTKSMRADIQEINLKVDKINKKLAEIEDVVVNVTNPSIQTIGQGHVNVAESLQEVRNTHNELNAKMETYDLRLIQSENDIKNAKKDIKKIQNEISL